MATDEELLALAEQSVNPTDVNAPSPVQLAPVIGTPEGPGIPPIAPEPLQTQPPTPAPIVAPAASGAVPGAPVVPTPAPLATPGLDMRAADLARESGHAAAQAAANKQPAIAQANEADAKGHQDLADIQNQQADDIEVERQAQAQGIKDAQAIADRAADEVKNFKFHDYFADQSTASKIMMNISYALGAFAAGGKRGHGVNPVAEKIKMLVENQYRMDKEALGTKRWVAEQKAKGVTDLRQAYQDDLEALKLKQALALKAAGEEAKSYLIQQQTPLKEAENNELVASLIKDADEKYSKTFEQMTRDKAMMALERAKLAATYASMPDPPQIQNAVAQHIADEMQSKKDPGEVQASAIALAAKLGSRNPQATVSKLLSEPDKNAALAARNLAKVGNEQAALRRERVAANIHEFNANAAKLRPGVITPEVLAKVQQNETDMHAMDNPHGAIDAAGNKILRAVGAVAKSPYDGLTREQTEAMRALDATLQHGAEMQPTTGAEVSQKWKQTYRPQPGMDQNTINQSLKNLQEMGRTFKAIIDKTNIGGRADAGKQETGHKPGDRVIYKGKTYVVGSDGDSLEPL